MYLASFCAKIGLYCHDSVLFMFLLHLGWACRHSKKDPKVAPENSSQHAITSRTLTSTPLYCPTCVLNEANEIKFKTCCFVPGKTTFSKFLNSQIVYCCCLVCFSLPPSLILELWLTSSQCWKIGRETSHLYLKITETVSFNIASEASYIYILSGQKFILKGKNGQFLKIWSLRSNSVTRQVSFNRTKIGGKIVPYFI